MHFVMLLGVSDILCSGTYRFAHQDAKRAVAAQAGTDTGAGGGVQGELEGAVRVGAAGPRPEESGVPASGTG